MLLSHPSPFSGNDRLSAQDLLTIRKVHDYAYNKLYGEEGRVDENGERLEPETCLEILCMDQVRPVSLVRPFSIPHPHHPKGSGCQN